SKVGPIINRIAISNFQYQPGDLSSATSIPEVRANKTLTFFNGDDKDWIWHTITTCANPCTAETGIAYPLANAMPTLDSLELGTTPSLGLYSRAEPVSGEVALLLTPANGGLEAGQLSAYLRR